MSRQREGIGGRGNRGADGHRRGLLVEAIGRQSRTPRPGCTTVVVTASVEKADLMDEVAKRYNASDRQVNGSCYGITVTAMASGVVESRLAEASWDPAWGPAPDAWSPAASTWLQLLRHDRASHDRPDILAADNRVGGRPRRSSSRCPSRWRRRWAGRRRRSAGRTCSNLANDPGGWASKGHPEWGAFKLGKTNPNVSTSGLSATIGAFVAATGTSSDLTLDTLKEPRVREFVAGVEKSVAHYGDTALTFLTNLQRADDAGAALGYVSAVAVEEKSVVDYNEGNPTGDLETKGQHGKPQVPLVAIYPKEGTLNSDSPFAVLQAPWSDAGKQAGAKDFLAYLREPAQQELFTDAGFRTYDGRPGKAVTRQRIPARRRRRPRCPRRARRCCPRSAPHGRNSASRRAYCWCWTYPGRWDSRRAEARPGWNSPRPRR